MKVEKLIKYTKREMIRKRQQLRDCALVIIMQLCSLLEKLNDISRSIMGRGSRPICRVGSKKPQNKMAAKVG